MRYKQRIENYRKSKKNTDYSFLLITASVVLSAFLKKTYDLTYLQAFFFLLLALLAVVLIPIALTIAFLVGLTLYEEGLVGLSKITYKEIVDRKESLIDLSKIAYQKIIKPILYGKRGKIE